MSQHQDARVERAIDWGVGALVSRLGLPADKADVASDPVVTVDAPSACEPAPQQTPVRNGQGVE